ncbi:MAG: DUF2799 domain-containing protein [Alphaproteobacteria bacterium]|nr:DUF2799 domain-containing protein [Alphaproteobacteria bacterium]
MLRFVAPCALALILAGCASNGMDLSQCRTADWRAIGYEDGSQGNGASALGGRRQDCAEHGVTPDFAAYMDGHGQGIAHFCRPQNGYQLGSSGYRYGGVCPAGLEETFLAAYGDGYGLYERRTTVNQLNKAIHRKQHRMKSLERRMAETTAALVSPQTPPSERLSIGVELKQVTEERIEIERDISQLEIDLVHAEREYQSYNESLARR